jgi:hypothetical protein
VSEPLRGFGGSDIGEYKTAHAMTMTAAGTVQAISATVTMSTIWQLNGKDLGKNFRVVESK